MSKILSTDELIDRVAQWERNGDIKVLATGVFDCLHLGHITLLKRAKEWGDILVVGINTDDTVARLKGPTRPYHSSEHRAHALADLDCVDAVCLFEEDTPEKLIHIVRPYSYVKGSDYSLNDMPEKEVVYTYGGAVITIPRDRRYSTTKILDSMR